MWNAPPDAELLAAAADGKLATAEEVAAQAQRMLADPRFEAKLPTFKQNPQFFVASEWQPAYKAFTDSGQVETLLLAPDSALEVLLGPVGGA